jgi:rhomboid protease GluP
MTEQTDTPSQARFEYPVTLGLIITITVIYALCVLPNFTGKPPRLILNWGAFNPVAFEEGEWWRIITANLLHASWSHVGSNALGLYVFGHMLEPLMSRRHFVALVILSGLGAMGLSYLLLPGSTIGASGIVFGLMFAYLTIQVMFERVLHPERMMDQIRGALGLMLAYFLWNWGDPSHPVNMWGHTGGALVGLVYGFLLARHWLSVL